MGQQLEPPVPPDLSAPSDGRPVEGFAASRRPRRPPIRLAMMIAVALIVVGAATAAAVAFVALKGTGDVLAPMVPNDTVVYVTAYLDPGAGQKLNLLRLAGRFPDLRAAKLDQRIDQVLDQALAESGLSARDVRSWIGSQIAVTVRVKGDRYPAAVLITSKDDAAATRALGKARTGPSGGMQTWAQRSHGGVTVWVGSRDGRVESAYALVDGVVVLSDDEGTIDAIIDTQQGNATSLAASARFTDTVASLATDRLLLAYVDVKPLVGRLLGSSPVEGIPGLPQVPSSFGQLDAVTSLGASIVAESNGIAVDFVERVDPGKLSPAGREAFTANGRRNSVLSFTPADAYLVMASKGLRATAQSAIDQFGASDPAFTDLDARLGISEAVSHLSGDYGFEAEPVAGSTIPGGAVLLGTDDQSGMRYFLDGIARMLGPSLRSLSADGTAAWKHTSYGGVDIASLPMSGVPGLSPSYAVSDGMAIVATSPEELARLLDTRAGGRDIASDSTFAATLGTHAAAATVFYVNVGGVDSAIREALPPDALSAYEAAAPDFKAIQAAAFSSSTEADLARIRLFVLIP